MDFDFTAEQQGFRGQVRSWLTQNVPAGALAIGRGRQRNIAGWVARRKQE